MINYAKHNVTTDDIVAVAKVLQSDRLTQGPTVVQFEEQFADYCGAKYCVAVSSGTAALHLAYLAVGVRPGETVLVDPASFVATANAALYCGATVEFFPDNGFKLEAYERWHKKHDRVAFSSFTTLGGDPTPNRTSFQWRPELTVVDACHGPFKLLDIDDGNPPAATCFSFHPCKHLAAGEGGAIITDDPLLDVAMRQARDHGSPVTKRLMVHMGFNYRMDEMSAALALSQLKRLDENIEKRREISHRYDAAFAGQLRYGVVPHSEGSARHLYQVLVEDRNSVRERLAQRGVGTQIHYEPIIPLQPYYAERFGYEPGDFPQAERYAARTLSIPLYPTLTEIEQNFVIEQILEVVHEGS